MTPSPPSSRQRGWMFTALGDDDLLMPEGIPARSLATMARRAWVQRESGGAPGPVRHSLTAEGRAALLTVPKLNALLSAEATGRISPAVAWPTLESLLREGLAVRLTDHGIPGTAAGPAYVSVLGRRLAGLPAVDERPAAQLLIEGLATRGFQASVESDKAGNSHVVHRAPGFEVLFYRVLGPGDDHSASHPAWMHDTAWYGFANREGDWAELARGLGGDDCATDSAKAADALVRLLSTAASLTASAGRHPVPGPRPREADLNSTSRLRLLEITRLADAADSALARAEAKHRSARSARAQAFADLGHWQHAACTAGDEYQHAALAQEQALAAYQRLTDTEHTAAGRLRRAATAARTAQDEFARAFTAAAGSTTDGGHRTAAERLLDELAAMPMELIGSVDALTVQSSAGKDSVVLLDRIATWAKKAGCLNKVVVVHADLQGADWPGVRELAERQARRYGLKFVTVSSPKTFLSMVEDRGMFPDAQNRLCTATLKRDEAAKLFTEITRTLDLSEQAVILNCLGIRAAESPARRRKRHLAVDRRASTRRRLVLTWHAVFDLTEADIWDRITSRTLEYHPVYDTLIPRLSCTYCILAPFEVLVEATRLCWLWNLDTPAAYVDVEQRIGHRFTHKFSLADVVAEARRRHETDGPLTFEPGDAIRRHVGEQAATAYLKRLGLTRTGYFARFGLAA